MLPKLPGIIHSLKAFFILIGLSNVASFQFSYTKFDSSVTKISSHKTIYPVEPSFESEATIYPIWSSEEEANIKISDLSKSYHPWIPPQNTIEALKNINLQFICSKPIAIIGENGCGKTSLLKCLSEVEIPTTGHFEVSGDRKLIYVNRNFDTDSSKSISNCVASQIKISSPKLDKNEVCKMSKCIIEMVQLSGKNEVRAKDLSGSDVLKFGLALALAKGVDKPNPPVLFLDGYLDHIDYRLVEKVENAIRNLSHKFNVGIIFSSHNMKIVFELAEAVVHLSQGEVLAVGKADEIVYAVTGLFEPLQKVVDRLKPLRLKKNYLYNKEGPVLLNN